MSLRGATGAMIIALVVASTPLTCLADTIFDPSRAGADKQIRVDDMDVARVDRKAGQLTLNVGTQKKWPGVRLLPAQPATWDLSDWSTLAVDIENHGAEALTIHLRIDNPAGTRGLNEPWTTQKFVVAPGERKTLQAQLRRAGTISPVLTGMQTFPQGMDDEGIDPSQIASVLVFLARTDQERTFSLGQIRGSEPYTKRAWESLNSEAFFPFVDEFGQFRHHQWRKKITDAPALIAQRRLEDSDLAARPALPDRSEFGGWTKGPRLTGTGHFTVTKRDGRWWLVDPQGYLFWSHGLGVVRTMGPTLIGERDVYFPASVVDDVDTPFHGTFDDGSEEGRVTYDFVQANLAKKYGNDWRAAMAQRLPRRMKSWGFNTYGLWSDRELAQAGELPYTQWLYYQSPAIQGSYKTGRMVDMWHADFSQRLDSAAGQLDALNNDPWLLGIFVDNELRWGDAGEFVASVMRSPKDQPAKLEFLKFLQDQYNNVAALNSAWFLQLDAWEGFLTLGEDTLTNAPNDDLAGFFQASANQYYRSVAAVVRAHAPNKLYLCSRFNGRFAIPEQAAAKYCDVISYNLYRTSVADFRALGKIDKPVLVSEFHFGTRDRGMFGAGLVEVPDQYARAKAYRHYLTGALRNPLIVGAHWFQYLDEPLTGRPLDGENFQIGLVSVTDTPYPGLTRAARDMGTALYTLRTKD